MAQKQERKEAWISIQEPDGREMIASPNYVRDKLLKIPLLKPETDRLGSRINYTQERLDKLENAVLSELLTPKAEKDVLRIIESNFGITTRKLHKTFEGEPNIFIRVSLYRALENLERYKEIMGVGQGSGKPKAWYTKIAALTLVPEKKDLKTN